MLPGRAACYAVAMPVGRIDDVVGGNDGLFPGDWFAYAAASAASAAAGATTTFVDAVGAQESREGWEVVHSPAIDASGMNRFRASVPPQHHLEHGAIAVMAAVLHARDGLRFFSVRQIGERCDYSLTDRGGNRAGVIELAGLSGRYTSDVAAKKRANVRRANGRPARIGIVAFGGPALRSEVVA